MVVFDLLAMPRHYPAGCGPDACGGYAGGMRLRFETCDDLWRLALSVALERPARPFAPAPLRPVRVRDLFARTGGPGGDAPAVVLVHGVIVSGRYLLPLARALARDVTVVVPDLPGYGLSAAPPAPPALADLADAAIACAEGLGHRRVALVGNSFGAQIALEAATRHPERVERLVLLGPTTDPRARSLARQYARWQGCAPDEHRAILPVMARDVLDMGVRRARHLLGVMLADAPEAKCAGIAAPALVVRGDRDRVVPAAWAAELAGRLPAGRLATVPGYAHMPHWSGTAALAPIVRRFVAAGT